MNDQHSPGSGAEAGPTPPASDAAALSLRRRRLLKIGAGAAPASLLLVGRPVHASYTCISTSAWGSTMVNASASVQARARSVAKPVYAWTVGDWKTNGYRGGIGQPWPKINCPSVDRRKTIAQAGLQPPAGVSSGATLISVIENDGNAFAQAMLVAQLNVRCLGGDLLSCVSSQTLESLRTNSYQPSWKRDWSPRDTVDYLRANGLAVYS